MTYYLLAVSINQQYKALDAGENLREVTITHVQKCVLPSLKSRQIEGYACVFVSNRLNLAESQWSVTPGRMKAHWWTLGSVEVTDPRKGDTGPSSDAAVFRQKFASKRSVPSPEKDPPLSK